MIFLLYIYKVLNIGIKCMMPKYSKRKLILVPYRLDWKVAFKHESTKIAKILGDNLLEIYHIGSTSIPGIYAKPILDILPVVRDISLVDPLNDAFKALGYEPYGELSIPQRRYFSKGGEQRSHHIHIFPQGNPNIEHNVLFRDFLIAHPAEAQRYSLLKQELAKRFFDSSQKYREGKHDFIQEIARKARFWHEKKKRSYQGTKIT
jgi:GrpB-like predicted nucleotidyltransferase (UPF0157 family)